MSEKENTKEKETNIAPVTENITEKQDTPTETLKKEETTGTEENTTTNTEDISLETSTEEVKSPEVIEENEKEDVSEEIVSKKEVPSETSKDSVNEDELIEPSTKEDESSEKSEKKEIPSEAIIKEDKTSETSTEEETSSEYLVKDEPQKDYTKLSEEELIAELNSLLKEKPVQEIKTQVEEIKTEFNSKFNKELEENKEKFLAEGGNIIDFYYTTPIKKEFDTTYYHYKHKRSDYYKNLTKDLNENLKNRLNLIEELKELFNEKENTSTIYKHFKNIQEKWYEAGAIPRDKNNTVWNNYHHHVENFYDILHLDREFRDRNFKQNLEQKLVLIGRAEELTKEENSNKAFRELQMLHKLWKEEIGPVAKEYSDEIWDKFSAATKVIHDKRHEFIKVLEEKYEANVAIKKEIIDHISEQVDEVKPSHQSWQNAINKVQGLRDQFFESGKVPQSSNKEIWGLFKEATREFNKKKNLFYKDQKKEQFDNLAKKLELIKIADENKDGDDFEVITPLMKKIQTDWKKIGHVPRKDSDKIWKQFKATCNQYFDRLHSQKDEANKEEFVHYDAKKEFLKSLEELKLEGDHKKDIATITGKIAEWKKLGRVPYNKRTIEQKFNKKLDVLFGQLDLDKKETELIKFENKLNTLSSQEDDHKLRNEEFFLSKKVGESKDEIRQLENNLLFFKHVPDDNPMVQDVHKKINKQKEDLEVWIAKLKKIRAIRKG